jgi:CheY-like chemotaxis protein
LELERVTRLKSQFLSSVSHEFRTPLNAILGFGHLLDEDKTGQLSIKQKEFVRHIHNAGRHLQQLTNDILDLSKIEAGQLELHREDFRVEEVFPEVLSVIRPFAAEKKIRLDANVNNVWVRADKFRFKQILLNLLTNAIKFTPARGYIKVEASADYEFAYISVTDTGIGIPAEYREKVFEEFYQLSPTTSGKKEGSGLGLSISRRLVEQQGGSISVDGKPGQGSRFCFALPVGRAGANTTLPVAHIPPHAAHPVTTGTNRDVLVVDDEQSVRDLLTNYLESEGYTVLLATSGTEAIEKAHQMRPAAITLDILMPGAGGTETLFQLKNSPETADIPVIIVSGMDSHKIGPIKGAEAYVTKPVEKAKLLDVLRKCLRHKT